MTGNNIHENQPECSMYLDLDVQIGIKTQNWVPFGTHHVIIRGGYLRVPAITAMGCSTGPCSVDAWLSPRKKEEYPRC